MNVNEVVRIAKRHFASVFADERVGDPTLEEVWFEPGEGAWYVTLGIRRTEPSGPLGLNPPSKIHYKTVKVTDEGGHPVWIKNANAA
jgi:hypothetical protein